MPTNTVSNQKTKNNQDDIVIPKIKKPAPHKPKMIQLTFFGIDNGMGEVGENNEGVSWLKHYRNRVIRFFVRIGWWMWAFWLPVQVFCFVEHDIFGVSNKIIHGIFLFIFGFWLLTRIFKCDGLLENQYGHDLRLWLEKNYPLKWKVDHWFMAS